MLENRRGFSLLEMVVVITILGIMAAVIVPQFGGTYQEALLRAAGRELLAVMNLAYSQAVASGRAVSLRVDPGEGRYWLEAAAGGANASPWEGRPEAGSFTTLTGLPGAGGRIDRRLSLRLRESFEESARSARKRSRAAEAARPSLYSVRFQPDGTADARVIVLEDREGARLELRIHPANARVEIKALGKEQDE